ncbi:helix-turn-helix domain-containing protein [Lysobacter sp. HDW10]|nr:helix-turn-helix domain-containing protein [Lysobacter sp. HDW10]
MHTKRIKPYVFANERRAVGLTQKAAAHHLGVSLRTIRNWESGVYRVPESAFQVLRAMREGFRPSGGAFGRGTAAHGHAVRFGALRGRKRRNKAENAPHAPPSTKTENGAAATVDGDGVKEVSAGRAAERRKGRASALSLASSGNRVLKFTGGVMDSFQTTHRANEQISSHDYLGSMSIGRCTDSVPPVKTGNHLTETGQKKVRDFKDLQTQGLSLTSPLRLEFAHLGNASGGES